MPRRAYSLLNTTVSMSLAYLPGSNNQKLLMPSVNLLFLILRFCRTVMNKKSKSIERIASIYGLFLYVQCFTLSSMKWIMPLRMNSLSPNRFFAFLD